MRLFKIDGVFSYVIYALYAHTARVEISIQGSEKKLLRQKEEEMYANMVIRLS